MPNLTTPAAAAQYEAALAYLTGRFRPTPESPGPVANWIVHNEIDHAWTWCNMGEQPTARLLDVYQRSLRMTDLLARRANPDARATISITHRSHGAWPTTPIPSTCSTRSPGTTP